jgi:hypothetical protein
MMSLRKPQAPLIGTCEEKDELRLIGSKGQQFEAAQVKPLRYWERPKKLYSTNGIGAFDNGLLSSNPSEKQTLLNRLAKESSRVDTIMGNTSSPQRGAAIDLIEGRRCRFVSPALLPKVMGPKPALIKVNTPIPDPLYPDDEIVYARGRLQSSHNSRGVIEKPWATVGQDYRTVKTDRTV